MTINELPTPCYLIDEEKIRRNCAVLKGVADRTSAKILLAQKAFSMYSLYPMMGEYLAGTTASGLYEAKLGKEEMKRENHVFSAAYKATEIDEIISLCDHIVFNSFSEYGRYKERVLAAGKEAGIRVNPQCSTQSAHAIYDPCAEFSRMGVTAENFREDMLDGISGLHFHTLCEQNSDDLKTTLDAVEDKFGKYLYRMKWLNFGGGHHITRDDYDIKLLEDCITRMRDKYGLQIYLEPGEAVAYQAGSLVTRVLDIVRNGMDIAVLDASAACHAPDILEMPYRAPLRNSGESGEFEHTYRLASATCLAGDVFGDYSFREKLGTGDLLMFDDMAIYSMVKNNTFNGMPLPAIAVIDKSGDCRIVREFGYRDFKSRL